MTIYIPLGKDCFPGSIIVSGSLNRMSMPFDSVFVSAQHLRHILDTNFSELLKEEYLSIDTNGNKIITKHSMYPVTMDKNINKFSPSSSDGFFNHHNLFDLETMGRYKKKIKNFKDVVESNQHIVFLSSINSDDFVSYGIYNYFKRFAKTEYVTCEWIESEKTKIMVSVKNEVKHISIFSKEKYNNKKTLRRASETLEYLIR